MADILTRMAERALGLQAAAMPLVRPVFSAPRKHGVTERKPQKQGLQQPSLVEAMQSAATHASLAVGAPVPQNHPMRKEPRPASVREGSLRQVEGVEQPSDHAVRDTSASDSAGRRPAQEFAGSASVPQEAIEVAASSTAFAPPPRRTPQTLQQVLEEIYEPKPPQAGRPQAPERPPQGASRRAATAAPARGIHDDESGYKTQARLPPATEPTSEPELPVEAVRPFVEPVPVRASVAPRGRTAFDDATRITTPPADRHDVQVTIGRIELHAASQPAPVPRPPAPAPRRTQLSLDEYLQRRRGERA
jgi:hypothetical protein